MTIARTYSLAACLETNTNLPPEVEEGNIEYKLKLQPNSEQRKHQLTSQLQWRLTEHGECFYLLGIDDCGTIIGVHITELEESLRVLQGMCASLGASITNVDRRRVSRRPELYAAEVWVKAGTNSEANTSSTPPTSSQVRRQVKIAWMGDSNAGKSTLMGVLTTGQLDNGHGSVRLSLLRHRHEVLSGKTSSLALEFLPFDPETRQPIRLGEGGLGGVASLEPIPLATQKQLLGTPRVAQLLDLPGDPKYQKVTLGCLTSWAAPDWICLVVAATIVTTVGEMSIDTAVTADGSLRDWLGLIIGLELPFLVVITKVDLVEGAQVDKLVGQLSNFIIDLRKELLGQTIPPYAVSIMKVSSVTGDGLTNLQNNIYRLHQRHNLRLLNYLMGEERLAGCAALYCVEGAQTVAEVGLVISGTLVHGYMEIPTAHHQRRGNLEQQSPQLSAALYSSSKSPQGPLMPAEYVFYLQKGEEWSPLTVKSAHRMRLPVRNVSAGQMVTLAVEGVTEEQIHKGQILVAYRTTDLPSPLPLFPMSSILEADIVDNTFNNVEGKELQRPEPPLTGTLYYGGGRYPARLQSLQVFYLELRKRARFELLDGQRVTPLPGTRCIFVGSIGFGGINCNSSNVSDVIATSPVPIPNFRIQGIVNVNGPS